MASGLVALDVVLRERDAVAALTVAVSAIRRYAEAPLKIRLERALEKDDADLMERVLAQHTEDVRLDLLEGSTLTTRVEQCESVTSVIVQHVLHFGVRHGRVEVIKWAIDFRDQETSRAIRTAISNGDVSIVKLLHKNSTMNASEVHLMNTAACHGHLDVLKCLYENRRDPSSACQPVASKDAARLGYADVLEWLYANNRVGFSPQVLAVAADHGQKRVMEWIFEQSIPTDVVGVMHAALEIGKTDMLEWLHDHYPRRGVITGNWTAWPKVVTRMWYNGCFAATQSDTKI